MRASPKHSLTSVDTTGIEIFVQTNGNQCEKDI